MIPEDARPHGDRISWADDEGRAVWDFSTDPYTTRPYSEAENIEADIRAAAAVVAANRSTLTGQAMAALAGNRDFLALASPTNAQTLAQVKALTRQMNAVIRLLVGDLSSTD